MAGSVLEPGNTNYPYTITHDGQQGGIGIGEARDEQAARLIASAPDLLAALKEATDALSRPDKAAGLQYGYIRTEVRESWVALLKRLDGGGGA